MDDHKASLVVFLDLSAAFDTIDHTILVNRLRNDYGLSGKARDWLESYLTDRYQSVHIKDNSSEYTKLKFGVPQGSVLRPLLSVLKIHTNTQMTLNYMCRSDFQATQKQSLHCVV